jgi:hypothetical protein
MGRIDSEIYRRRFTTGSNPKLDDSCWLAFFERLRGACFSRTEISWRPESGTAMCALLRIFLAVIVRPYTSPLASSSGRSDVPSTDAPANNPRDRE